MTYQSDRVIDTTEKREPEIHQPPLIRDFETVEDYTMALVDWRLSLAGIRVQEPPDKSAALPGGVPGADIIQPPVLPPQRGLAKVAGMHALKELLRSEVVEPVRNPEPYRRYRLSIPNGILLYGPPGCGKTYIARHLAEE
ncbi:MAG TPA: AAA family ATPase, partial [Candidatus Angelobacter sp.]|nr:AAA family ATPase [Candidatus Angelobacter sp.]